MADTEEQVQGYIAGLLEEQRGAAARLAVAQARVHGAPDEVQEKLAQAELDAEEGRAKSISAELARVGHKAAAPAKRAERRPAPTAKEKR